jgi:hypothetical protein
LQVAFFAKFVKLSLAVLELVAVYFWGTRNRDYPFGKAKDDFSREEKCGSSPYLKVGVPAARNYDG